MNVAAVLPAVLQQPHPGSVPGISDTTAIIAGTLLTLAVIYAILAARLRRADKDSPR